MKKAQLSSGFVYIASLVMIVLILIFSGYLIAKLKSDKSSKEMIEFKISLSKAIDMISDDVDSIKKITLHFPSQAKLVCIVDLEKVNISDLSNFSYIQESIKLGNSDNVFIFTGDSWESVKVYGIHFEQAPYFSCSRKRYVEVSLKGTGDGAVLSMFN